jgi:ribose 5-phosphate isomerase
MENQTCSVGDFDPATDEGLWVAGRDSINPKITLVKGGGKRYFLTLSATLSPVI